MLVGWERGEDGASAAAGGPAGAEAHARAATRTTAAMRNLAARTERGDTGGDGAGADRSDFIR